MFITIRKNYCAKKDIRNDVLHQVDLVANVIPDVEELTCFSQRNLRIAIIKNGLSETVYFSVIKQIWWCV